MNNLIRATLLIARKDLVSELRSRDVVLTVPVFPLIILFVLHFMMDLAPSGPSELAPDAFWVAFSFAGLLAMRHSFLNEQDRTNMDGLLLLPVPREALYLGKLLAGLIFMLAIEMIMVPIFAVMLDVSVLYWQLPFTFFLATVAFAAIAALLSALMSRDRGREVMLPLFFFPSVLPILTGAVRSTAAIMQHTGAHGWMWFLAICAIIYLAVCTWLSSHVLDD